MPDDVLDPKMQKLVAALYGELSGEEEQEFQKLLEEDPALRAEWEELQASRFVLASLETDEASSPGFVFLADEPVSSRREPESWWERARAWFGTGPAWGLAAAAAVVAVLGLTDFRVQRVDGGVAFRFGEPEPAAVDVPGGGAPQNLAELLGDQAGKVTPVSGGAPYLTRTDLDTYETQMLRLVRAMLEDYKSYRDQELAGVVRALYSDMDRRQDDVYDDLRGRVEALNVELEAERTQSDLRYQDLLRNREEGQRLDDAPRGGPRMNDQREEDNQ